ncbi:MAG TPA: ATP-binding protein [Stenotrophomonas sp.]
MAVLKWPVAWLRAAPIADPVDRRNATMLQVVLLLLGTLPPLAWVYRATAIATPWRPGELTSLALSVVFSAVALFGVVLIRWGRYRWAAYQLLGVFAISVCASYAAGGFGSQRFEQPVLTIPLAIAALAVGRPALWAMFVAIMVAFWLGVRTDLPQDAFGDAVISGAIFLLIALIFDRTSAALRQALGDAQLRAEQLDVAHATLQREVAERRNTEDQLVNARKVEAVARLAAGLNHDFNHLLSLVSGYVRKARRASDARAQAEALDGIESAASRAAAISGKLLNFSRPDDSQVEALDLGALVSSLRPLLRQTLKPQIQLQVDVAEGLWVDFDRQQLELILLNLVGNADEALSAGGRVELSARQHGNAVQLRCRDDGPGIAEALRSRVFEAFFTTKPGSGAGLGLAMAQGLMERHGARIAIEAGSTHGASFLLEFPPSRAHTPGEPALVDDRA